MGDEFHRDYTDREVRVGDRVILIRPRYRDLVTGVVVRVTPKKLRIKYHDQSTQTDEFTIQEPHCVVREISR